MINELRRSYGMRPAVHVILISIAATLCSADEASPTAPLKSEIPPVFTANTESFDYVRRTEMIPMHDGVKLYTVILIRRGARCAPILLTRTPYDATPASWNCRWCRPG